MDKPTELAYDRTWLAYERTLQAWVRTAISCITFGFTVYKLTDIVGERANRAFLTGPRELGIVLVCIGLLALAMATIQYRQSIRVLRLEYGRSPRSTAVWFAGIVALLGVFALASMFFRP
ncbi:MAG: DUF202 domain-containing protein [Candidatus Eremiobacteraeota bacterium]|nr:DUF202 domain-containing protein [Candidatus Eremiobacteraeota bacterium]